MRGSNSFSRRAPVPALRALFFSSLLLFERVEADPLVTAGGAGALDISFEVKTDVLPFAEQLLIRTLVVEPTGHILLLRNSYDPGPDPTSLMAGGEPRKALARLHSNGTLDQSFELPDSDIISIHAVQIDPLDRILIGGYFSRIRGTEISGMARLTTSGALDPSFSSPQVRIINTLLLQPDQKILFGGTVFINDPGAPVCGRLHPDGELDQSFFSRWSAAISNVAAVRSAASGDVFITGDFHELNGLPAWGLARLCDDQHVDI